MGSYLHRIAQSSTNGPQSDLIREFSFQILQEPIFISANGFFHIDIDLLGSVSCETNVMQLSILFDLNLSNITASSRNYDVFSGAN